MNFLPEPDFYSVNSLAQRGEFDPSWDAYAASPEHQTGMSYGQYAKSLEAARLQAAENNYRLMQLERQQANPSNTIVGPDMAPPSPPAPNQVMKPSVNDQVAGFIDYMTEPYQPVPQTERSYQLAEQSYAGTPRYKQIWDQWGIGINPHDKAMGSMSGYPKHIVEKW